MKINIVGGLLRRTALLGFFTAGVLLATVPAQASAVNQPAGWGVGVMLGSPTGITAKRWIGGANAWDVGLGFGGFGFYPGFRLHADYLWGIAQVLPNTSDVTLDIYLGVGPVVGAGRYGSCNGRYDGSYYNDCGVGYVYGGGRVPMGVDLRFQKAPIEFAFEAAPGMIASPHYLSGMLDVALIARYLF